MSFTESTVIYEYEEILLGKKNSFLASLKGDGYEIRRRVGDVWRYAITNLLGWTPQEAVTYLTDDIVKTLRLDKTLKGVGFNFGKEYAGDYKFVLRYAFPGEIHFDLREQSVEEWEHVAKRGKWKADAKPYRYPKKFFSDQDGINRADLLMRHVVNLYLSGKTTTEKYLFFADAKESYKFIKKHCLDKPLNRIYGDPLEYFHSALPPVERDVFMYYTIKLNRDYYSQEQNTVIS